MFFLFLFMGNAVSAADLADAERKSELKPTANAVSDEMLMKEYEKYKAAMGDKEYNVAHIMVTSEDYAKQLIERLNKGESFAELAKVYSADPGSARKGGELGWNVPSVFVHAFAEAVARTPPGSYTPEPVHTPFGWHIVKIDAVRPAKIPPFEEVKEAIRAKLLAKQSK